MVDLPNFGARVFVWPMPGRSVQAGDTPILDGGTFLLADGQEVEWSTAWHRRLLAGEIAFTDPRGFAPVARVISPPTSVDAARAAVEETSREARDKRAEAKATAERAALLLQEADAADKAERLTRDNAVKVAKAFVEEMSTKKAAPSAEEK